MTNLLAALILVESSGNDLAYNRTEKAAGCLQIRPIMVREVNRLSGRHYRHPEDCWDRRKSCEMALVYFGQWPDATEEQLARRWNGGPTGDRKKSTLRYWSKVKDRMR